MTEGFTQVPATTAKTPFVVAAEAVLEGETCDRCGPSTRAVVVVEFLTLRVPAPHAGRLTFCGHHWDALRALITSPAPARPGLKALMLLFQFDSRA
jgi:hypothetical protein